MEGPLGGARLERIPVVLVLKDDGTHEEVSTFRFSPPAPRLDKPGFPHWAYRAVEEPEGGFVVRQVVPVAQMPGVQPLNRATVPYRPIARANARGEVYDDVALVATPAGQDYYVREALRGGLTFGPAAGDLSRDFSVAAHHAGADPESASASAVYHHGVYREIPIAVGPHLLGRAHVSDEGGEVVLLGVEPGPAAYTFRLWNLHLATVAGERLVELYARGMQRQRPDLDLVDEMLRLTARYHHRLYDAINPVNPDALGRVPWAVGLSLIHEILISEDYFLDNPCPSLPRGSTLVYLKARHNASWGLRVAPSGESFALPESLLPFQLPGVSRPALVFGLPAQVVS